MPERILYNDYSMWFTTYTHIKSCKPHRVVFYVDLWFLVTKEIPKSTNESVYQEEWLRFSLDLLSTETGNEPQMQL